VCDPAGTTWIKFDKENSGMKKLLTLLFAVAIAFSLTTSTFAQDTAKKDDTKKEEKKEKKAKKEKKDKKDDKMKDDKMKEDKK
jgi:pentapeptide MXKDX repeat protein